MTNSSISHNIYIYLIVYIYDCILGCVCIIVLVYSLINVCIYCKVVSLELGQSYDYQINFSEFILDDMAKSHILQPPIISQYYCQLVQPYRK